MTTITQVITALPTAPDPLTMTPALFSATAAASVLAQKAMTPELNSMTSQMNTVAGEVNTNAAAASGSASTATTQAANASASAAAAAASATTALTAPGTNATSTTSLTISVGSKAFTLAQTGKSFVLGQWVTISDSAGPTANWMVGAISAFNSGTGAITVQTTVAAGTLTGTNWVIAASAPVVATGSLPVTPVSGTTQTGVAGNFYVMGNVAASTFTLPAAPSANDEVWVMFTNGLYSNNVARNGSTIYGAALDFLINAGVLLVWKFKYLNGDWKTV
jgi:hypothetical protein